jgi:HEAT repeat protein
MDNHLKLLLLHGAFCFSFRLAVSADVNHVMSAHLVSLVPEIQKKCTSGTLTLRTIHVRYSMTWEKLVRDWAKKDYEIEGLILSEKLTDEEIDVVLAMFPTIEDDKFQKDAAENILISHRQLKQHCGSIYEKLDLSGNGKKKLRDGLVRGYKARTTLVILPELEPTIDRSISLPIKESIAIPPQIDWYTICNHLLTEHKRQLSSNPLDVKGKSFEGVYVPLGLVERKEKQRPQIDRNLDPSADRGSEFYRVEETIPIEHDDFLHLVGDRQTGEHIVILGEPGAGKTTLLTRVWQFLLDTNRETPIIIAWISLAAVKDLDLEEYLHHVWLKQICKSTEIDTYWQSFQTLLDRQRVWLLFDGADEMGGAGLTKIQTMLKPIWVKSTIRSIVTCRLNLWDASSQNVLKNDFQIFRTLDFKQDLVEAFIVKWFDDDAVAGKKLIAALDETGKERIKDLARNPLRLTLLCNIWRRGESLPDTQAGLYHKFVNYFYNWSKFPELVKLRGELDRLMGQLAKYGINKSTLRFRFTETELRSQSIDPEYIEALETLGWLNFVGVDERDDKVYAFFHPTFQEYFAACAIDDWDYFLPRAHIDRPVPCEGEKDPTYRVFEQEWRQVILFWVGRSDLRDVRREYGCWLKKYSNHPDLFLFGCFFPTGNYQSDFRLDKISYIDEKNQLKEEFIENLTSFYEHDGLFYYFRAYNMAAICVSEFKSSSIAREIVQKTVERLYTWDSRSIEIIPITHRMYAIEALIQLLHKRTLNNQHCSEIFDVLGKIGVGNQDAINALIQLLQQPDLKDYHLVLDTLGTIGAGNQSAIEALTQLLQQQTLNNQPFGNVLRALGTVGVGHKDVINTLIQLLQQTALNSCFTVLNELEKIGVGNQDAINALVQLLQQPDLKDYHLVLDTLGTIGARNQSAINALVQLLQRPDLEDYYCNQILVWVLGQIGMENQDVINAVIKLLEQSDFLDSHHCVMETLIRIRMGRQGAIDTLLQLLQQPNFENSYYLTDSLGLIASGNQDAINILVQLLRQPDFDDLHYYVIDVLGQIGMGNQDAIDALIQILLQPDSNNLDNYYHVIEQLGQIGVGNQDAINILVQLLRQPDFGDAHYYIISEALGLIGEGNQDAINILVQLLRQPDFGDVYYYVISEALGLIGVGNQDVIDALLQLLRQPDLDCYYEISEVLEKVLTTQTITSFTILKLKNDREYYRCDSEQYRHYTEILSYCAQTLSYLKFYTAWHPTNRPPSPQRKKI